MRRFITVLTLALTMDAVSRSVAAQEVPSRRDHQPVWIGAMCVPVEEALRAQLQIEKGVGLLVAEIVPDSPADKGGLKRFDVLVAADGKALNHVGELMKAVEGAGDDALKLELYRGGKKESLEVKPDARPRGDVLVRRFNLPLGEGRGPAGQSPEQIKEWMDQIRKNLPEEDAKRMQEWVEQMQRGDVRPFRMNLFGPGVLMNQAAPFGLPKDVKVLVKRSGDDVEVHVERGDKKWDVSSKDFESGKILDKLPEDLRGPIGQMIRGGAGANTIVVTPQGAAAAAASSDAGPVDVKVEVDGKVVTPDATLRPLVVPAQPQGPTPPDAKEFEALKKQVEQLQKQLEELNKQNAPAKESAKKPAKDKA